MSDLISAVSIIKLVAVLHALFFGFRAVYIFSQRGVMVSGRNNNGDLIHEQKSWQETKEDINRELKERPDYFFYQFVFNFIGVIVGYFALYLLWNIQPKLYSWEELIMLLIAFVGITGNLPWFVMLKGFPGR